jgi:hypothetical protein
VNCPEPKEIFPDNPDGARGLRSQAAACRRLAVEARTRPGTSSMHALAEHFEEQARKLDLTDATGSVAASAQGAGK